MKLEDLVPYVDDLADFPVPTKDLRGMGDHVSITMTLKYTDKIQFSKQLPKTKAWAYEGTVPGPSIVVDQHQTVQIRWHNEIVDHTTSPSKHATLPFPVVVCADAGPNDANPNDPPQNRAGSAEGVVDELAAALTASIVTHLHGGLTAPDSDGWAENVYPVGRSQYATYGKAGLPHGSEQRAALMWYHDHGMGVTRLNVYAGLFGFWVLRDPVEYSLIKSGILPNEADEYFLVIQDRNFETDDQGNLTGDLLHKTETSTAEMFGPCTLVNGKLWPVCKMPPRPVRLRILNGSNSRTYCLRMVTLTKVATDSTTVTYSKLTHHLPIWQVGSDGGLFLHPVDLSEPNSGSLNLVLAPAERADLVVDFSEFGGQQLAFVNTAFAPFHGSTVTNPNRFDGNGSISAETDQTQTPPIDMPIADPGTGDNPERYLPFRLKFPHVIQFDVQPATKVRTPINWSKTSPVLDPNCKRYVHGDIKDEKTQTALPENHTHRWIALDENPTGNLTFRELVPYTTDPDVAAAVPAGMPLIPIAKLNGVVTWYKTVAKGFHDPVSFFIRSGSCEIWNILNLTGDTHPVHLHLVQFQVMTRQRVNADSFQTPTPGSGPVQPIKPLEIPKQPDANETGFKDTVRSNPGEILQIAAFFNGYCGKYMYHCHILEHEDHDMMRPFVVVAPDAFDIMAGEMGGMKM